MLTTKIDEMVDLLGKNKKVTYREIAKKLSWDERKVEKAALILEKAKLAKTHYSMNLLAAPSMVLLPAPKQAERSVSGGKVIDEYEISEKEGHSFGSVKICYSEKERRPVYEITLPTMSAHTRAYIEYVKTEVSLSLPLGGEEKSSEDVEKLFSARHSMVAGIIQQDLFADENTLDMLTDTILNEMYGLGELEALIGDRNLEEIIINSCRVPVSVYHRKRGWLKTNIEMRDEADIENYAQQIARKVGRQISTLSPVLDAHLGTGDRVNATLYPISSAGNTITLRLFARNPWTMVSFSRKENNVMSPQMAALLWQAVQYEMNVVVAGGTASGKTSALNGLLALVQPFQRILTIEDTRELVLPSYQWNWVPMLTRQPNPEGLGEVTMLDLLVNALRMRPDRIVMGEIRRKKEAEVLFEAMHTGHSVYSTIHADTGPQVLKRLTEPPIEIPRSEVEDLHLLLVQYRDRRKNLRRTLELSEVVVGASGPEIGHIYTWKPRDDTFQFIKSPHRYLEELNLRTGMTEADAVADQKDKVCVLDWMSKYNLDTVEDVGRVMKLYYSEPDLVVGAAKKGLEPSKVL